MAEMTAINLLRESLEKISEKDPQWALQRALLDMAEKQEEHGAILRRLTEDGRDLRTMVERALHR